MLVPGAAADSWCCWQRGWLKSVLAVCAPLEEKKKMLGSSIPCAGSCECQGRGWKRKPCAPIGNRGSISDRDLGMGKENATFPYSPWLCSIFSWSCCIFAIFSFTGMCGNIKALLNDGPVLHTMPQGLCTQQMRSLMQGRWVLGYGCAESQGAGLLQGWHPTLSVCYSPAPSQKHTDFIFSGADLSYLLPMLRASCMANKQLFVF